MIKQIKDGVLRPDVSRAERLKVLVDLDEEGEQPSESGESEYHEEDPPEIHVASMSNEQAISPSDIVDEFSFCLNLTPYCIGIYIYIYTTF